MNFQGYSSVLYFAWQLYKCRIIKLLIERSCKRSFMYVFRVTCAKLLWSLAELTFLHWTDVTTYTILEIHKFLFTQVFSHFYLVTFKENLTRSVIEGVNNFWGKIKVNFRSRSWYHHDAGWQRPGSLFVHSKRHLAFHGRGLESFKILSEPMVRDYFKMFFCLQMNFSLDHR